MFGIDAPELLVIAIVALIFIGPKELPGMLRSIGKWVATARNMAGEFRGHVDEMMRQAELDELKKQVEEGTKDAVLDLQALDPTREIKAAIDDGASEAQKEMDAARAAIDSSTGDALPAPPVAAAELTAPADATPPTEAEPLAAGTVASADSAAIEPAAPAADNVTAMDSGPASDPPAVKAADADAPTIPATPSAPPPKVAVG